MTPLALDANTHLLVLTGAGISAESGVPTFRDAGGLWEGHAFEDVASPRGFQDDPVLVWKFYSQRRAGLASVAPNPAHHALVEVERELGDRFLLVTQNVDGLHPAAGSQRMVEMHGNICRSRCTSCRRPAFEDRTAYRDGLVPMCGLCKEQGTEALLRPDVVWFGEAIPHGVLSRIDDFVHQARSRAGSALRFLAVGTSGVVYPAAALVDVAKRAGGKSWLVNAERPANVSSFDEVVIGPAGKVLPELFAWT
jgi:NAD-dependent deacetylase